MGDTVLKPKVNNMTAEDRQFCPENISCEESDCSTCEKTLGDIGHEINKNYLRSIGRICLCSECADV